MGRKLSSLALFGTVLAGLFAYLYYVPNSEGVEQMDRIRLLNAAMKLIGFVVSVIYSIIIRLLHLDIQGKVSETFGFPPAWYIQRNSGLILKKLKPVEIITDIEVKQHLSVICD